MKYHISEDGNPRPCKAREGNCPVSEEADHFATADEARAHFEKTQKAFTSVDLKKKFLADRDLNDAANAVRRILSEKEFVAQNKLLKPAYLDAELPLAGHCYVASEIIYHLAGGKSAGWVPAGMEHEGSQHWWLRAPDGTAVDLTAEQFHTPVPYKEGKGRGFLTRDPSKRAQTVMAQLEKEEPELVKRLRSRA